MMAWMGECLIEFHTLRTKKSVRNLPMSDEMSPEFAQFERLALTLLTEWQMYEELFIRPENEPLFRNTGALFWAKLRYILLDNIILGIARFFDPPDGKRGSSNRKNLSLRFIVTLPELSPIREEVEKKGKLLWPVYQRGADHWRNGRIGHNDLMNSLEEPLPDIDLKDLETLVDGIWDIIAFAHHVLGGVEIRRRVSFIGWVPDVMKYLKLGLESERNQSALLKAQRNEPKT